MPVRISQRTCASVVFVGIVDLFPSTQFGTRKLADSRTRLGDAVALSAAERLQPVLGLLDLTGPMIGKGQVPGGVAPENRVAVGESLCSLQRCHRLMIVLEEQLGHAQIELGRPASRLTTDQRLQPAFCLREIVPAQCLERSSEIVGRCGFARPAPQEIAWGRWSNRRLFKLKDRGRGRSGNLRRDLRS